MVPSHASNVFDPPSPACVAAMLSSSAAACSLYFQRARMSSHSTFHQSCMFPHSCIGSATHS